MEASYIFNLVFQLVLPNFSKKRLLNHVGLVLQVVLSAQVCKAVPLVSKDFSFSRANVFKIVLLVISNHLLTV